MKDIKVFFFVAGGMLLPDIYSITLQMLGNKGMPVTNKQRAEISRLGRDLFIGKIPAAGYLSELSSLAGLDGSVTENDLLDLIKVDSGALVIAADLAAKGMELVLFSDYPRTWLAKFDQAGSLTGRFNRVIYSQDLEYPDIQVSIIDLLAAKQQLVGGKCMWLDGDPVRTSRAIRLGIDAIIYVDERRARRELNLRALI